MLFYAMCKSEVYLVEGEDVLDIGEDELSLLLDQLGTVESRELVQVGLDDELEISDVDGLGLDKFGKGLCPLHLRFLLSGHVHVHVHVLT